MSDKLRNAALLPFLLAGTGAVAAEVPVEHALVGKPLAENEFARRDVTPAPQPDHDAVFVGSYRLLRELGAGGMGVVYLGESTEPVQRRVALKLIHAGLLEPAMVAQFDVERRALASAEHEHVARFLDAGTASDGRPWLAMEVIDGEPITAYCDRRQLDINARLELFEQVCRAVEHLHERDVLHGDLKPANILVRERDGYAVPKIIDLGLARIAGQEPGGPDALMGTPAYMAPEQFALPARARDERSDVYSLGIVLRELLVGPRPENERGFGMVGSEPRSEFQELPTASEYLQSLGHEADLVARRRGSRASRLRRRLRRSLDRIEARARARQHARRYASAAELADAIAGEVVRETWRSNLLKATALVSTAAIASFLGGLSVAGL